MEVAHDLTELKELISRLGLKEERRQSPRYNIEIAGNYNAEPGKAIGPQGKCWLVDVSKEGISIKVNDKGMKVGTILQLELPMGSRTVSIATKVVHVQSEKDFCTVGLKATSEKDNIIKQLFGS
jgi:hypothetical protein